MEEQVHSIIATIYNYEDAHYPVIFEQDRLIFPVDRSVDPDERVSRTEAVALLRKYYPAVPLVSVQEFRKTYQGQGFYRPDLNTLLTPYLCMICQTNIKLKPRSRGAGRNTPHGVLVHCWYDCPGCNTIYDETSEERQFGIATEWWYQPHSQGAFLECDEPPRIPDINPFGFKEERLGRKKDLKEVELS